MNTQNWNKARGTIAQARSATAAVGVKRDSVEPGSGVWEAATRSLIQEGKLLHPVSAANACNASCVVLCCVVSGWGAAHACTGEFVTVRWMERSKGGQNT